MSDLIEGPIHITGSTCQQILRSLPEWFGIEKAIVDYAREVESLDTFIARDEAMIQGFLTIKIHNQHSGEIYLMGVRAAQHRRGIGRALVNRAQDWLLRQNVLFLQVKTLGPSRPNEAYASTRAFYGSMGFRPLEEIKGLWDQAHPCLIMIKHLRA